MHVLSPSAVSYHNSQQITACQLVYSVDGVIRHGQHCPFFPVDPSARAQAEKEVASLHVASWAKRYGPN
eukprot:3892594-Ditylum_brightwellii.AAC.1